MKQEILLGAGIVVLLFAVAAVNMFMGQPSAEPDFSPLNSFSNSSYFEDNYEPVTERRYSPPFMSGEQEVGGFLGAREVMGAYVQVGETGGGTVRFRIFSFTSEEAAQDSVANAGESLMSFGGYEEVDGPELGSRTLYLVDRNENPMLDVWRIKFSKGTYQYGIKCQLRDVNLSCKEVAQTFSEY